MSRECEVVEVSEAVPIPPFDASIRVGSGLCQQVEGMSPGLLFSYSRCARPIEEKIGDAFCPVTLRPGLRTGPSGAA